ncbi:hypothetical protein [Rhodospirillum sp. A1_3_36]|uniref:hypothetical protein n=1 Tax=Rhodospirillum sp. A1_3_36 TaxID=3391666 RepID=UPI0039A691CD
MTMKLEVENKKPMSPKNFSSIERNLRALKSYGPHSFAILSKDNGSYVQVAGGRVTCVVEMRDGERKNHFRAHLEEKKVPFDERLTIAFGGGKLTVDLDEILFIEDVIKIFKAFFEDGAMPNEIKWRDISVCLK